MSEPRVLYFSSLFPSPATPHLGAFSLRRVQALVRAGADVEVLCPVGVTPPLRLLSRPAEAARWVQTRMSVPRYAPAEGVAVTYSRWSWPPKALAGGLDGHLLALQVARSFDRLVARFRPDAVLASWLPDAAAACLLGRRHGLSVVAIAEGSDLVELPQRYPWWSRMRAVLAGSSALVFVSDALRAAAPPAGLEHPKELVVHNGFDESLFVPGVGRARPEAVVLTVGRFEDVKSQATLLEAAALLRRRLDRPLKVVLVGDGPLELQLRSLADKLGLNGSAEFKSARAQRDLVPFYQAADVFCLPSRAEAMGCVLVEAMGCGVPVVASRVGGVPEVVDDETGILVPPSDPEALAAGLESALRRPWRSDAIRAHAVANFTWDRAGTRFRELIEEVTRAA